MNKKEEEKLRKQQEKLEKELARMKQMSIYEEEYGNCEYICGIDEVGRGPLAGPVVAAAVILPKYQEILYLNDSKKLSDKKREAFRLSFLMSNPPEYPKSNFLFTFSRKLQKNMCNRFIRSILPRQVSYQV